MVQTLVDKLNHYLGDLDESLKIMVIGVAHSNPDYAHWYGKERIEHIVNGGSYDYSNNRKCRLGR